MQGKGGRKLSERLINNIMQQLGSVFEQETVRGHIGRNPSKAVKKLQEEKPEVDPFSEVELVAALRTVDPCRERPTP